MFCRKCFYCLIFVAWLRTFLNSCVFGSSCILHPIFFFVLFVSLVLFLLFIFRNCTSNGPSKPWRWQPTRIPYCALYTCGSVMQVCFCSIFYFLKEKNLHSYCLLFFRNKKCEELPRSRSEGIEVAGGGVEGGRAQLFDGQPQLFDGPPQLFDGQPHLYDSRIEVAGGREVVAKSRSTRRRRTYRYHSVSLVGGAAKVSRYLLSTVIFMVRNQKLSYYKSKHIFFLNFKQEAIHVYWFTKTRHIIHNVSMVKRYKLLSRILWHCKCIPDYFKLNCLEKWHWSDAEGESWNEFTYSGDISLRFVPVLGVPVLSPHLQPAFSQVGCFPMYLFRI